MKIVKMLNDSMERTINESSSDNISGKDFWNNKIRLYFYIGEDKTQVRTTFGSILKGGDGYESLKEELSHIVPIQKANDCYILFEVTGVGIDTTPVINIEVTPTFDYKTTTKRTEFVMKYRDILSRNASLYNYLYGISGPVVYINNQDMSHQSAGFCDNVQITDYEVENNKLFLTSK